jgi:enamine deaminase RidA (YjgF/YER057c/UK114 family)
MSKSIIANYRQSGNLLFFSGVTGESGDAKTQIANIFEKMKKNLQDAGSSMENVLSVLVFLKDLNDRPTALNPLWEKHFPTNPPSRTTVQAELGPGMLAEMTFTAQTRAD